MGLIENASNKSLLRGLDYYNSKKVLSWTKDGENSYDGIVSGSNGENYKVHIDTKHIRKSKCNCPFAKDRRVICKHMIALYFTAEPQIAKDFFKQVEIWEQEEEKIKMNYFEGILKYVNSLSKEELRNQLFEALIELKEMNEWFR